MTRRKMLGLALVALVPGKIAEAGWPWRRAAATTCTTGQCAAPTYTYVPVEQYAVVPATAPYGIPYTQTATDWGGFLGWLNAVRARVGCGPVAWSSELCADAAANSSRGYGHSFMGRARRQNVGSGALSIVQSMWLGSPAHYSALVDPTVTMVGLANVNGIWTVSLR